MAEIRCPMCGKLNPAERQVCQFCDARLVPLIAETPAEEEKPSQPDEISPAKRESKPKDEYSEQEEPSPDWLTDLREDDSSSSEAFEEQEFQDASSDEDEEAEDWFSRLDEEAPGGESLEPEDGDDDFDVEEASDWLSRLEEGPQEDEPKESEAQKAEETLPDHEEQDVSGWLSQLDAEGQEDQERQPEGASPESEQFADKGPEEAEIPEWLQQMQAAQQESSEQLSGEAVESFEQDLDWLSEEAQSDSEALPDWLRGVAQQDEEVSAEPAEAESIPDWLSEIPDDAIAEQFDAQSAPQEEQIEELPFEDEALAPDWLSEMPTEDEGRLEAKQPEEVFDFGEFALEEGEGEEAAPVEPLEAEQPEEVYTVELPDQWFPEEFEELQSSSDEEVEPEISRAEIPSWLESMRPVEDAAPSAPVEEKDNQQVESAGPLAGLRGVLSAEPEIAKVQKPPAYSIKLHVTENQHAHADLLKSMLAEEGQPQPIAGPAIISPQHLLRAVIGLILIVAVFWPVLTGTQQAPLPTFSPETAAANRLISQLPNQARVLMSFDYEPGLTGEMDAAASAVVDHLMLRGAYLTLVSTSPMGPIVAERFLSTAQAEHNYTSLEEYINLGFIPGGPAGLLSFAETPQRILPYTLDGNFAWSENLTPLQGIERLADFDLVLVITDNSNVARIWVEQVQPYLESGDSSVPLMMVTSAQAEPLVRPYYQAASGQVQGLVSGLQGGGAYALLTGRGGLARQYWDAFSLGLWVAAMLVISGGVINIVLVILERNKKA
ncbi:MAG TPA: hypothetical protein VFZ76_09470 [Anaerolineales bacterium]